MIDVEAYLRPLSDESPCGEDLEYDPAFGAMERASQGKPEQQYGGTVVPAEEPNWAEVRSNAFDLMGRTKDLRVAVMLTRAVLGSGGFVDFSGVLSLIRGWIESYWEPLYPRLDPDDDLDPTIRVNLLASLCDSATLLNDLKKTPLVSSRMAGRFGLREIAIAKGEIPAPESMASPPTLSMIDGAFQDAPLEDLQATFQAVGTAAEEVSAIESAVTGYVGSGRAASLGPLVAVLNAAKTILTDQLGRRGVLAGGGDAGRDSGSVDPESGLPAEGGGRVAQALTGEILTREDVVKAIDKICEYYARHEPSSPLPLLLKRAKRLSTMSFMEILQDLVPDGVPQAQLFGGTTSEE